MDRLVSDVAEAKNSMTAGPPAARARGTRLAHTEASRVRRRASEAKVEAGWVCRMRGPPRTSQLTRDAR